MHSPKQMQRLPLGKRDPNLSTHRFDLARFILRLAEFTPLKAGLIQDVGPALRLTDVGCARRTKKNLRHPERNESR
jgi:hypothetical protein